MTELLSNTLVVSILSLLAGALITAVATKLQGRTARLTYSTRSDRIALAAADPIFGAVKVSWRDHDVRNLHIVSLEIENVSTRDFENVDLNVYTAHDTILLSERTAVVDTPYIVNWSDDFKAQIAVEPGQTPTTEQRRVYNHSRDYRVPVLNRGQRLHFTYLCTRPADDAQPGVFVSTRLKGARLSYQVRSTLVLGIPVQIAAVRGSVLSVLVVIGCGLLVRDVWIASAICMSVGLFAQMVGAVQYKFERSVKRLIAG